MNNINLNRLKHVREVLDELEYKLLPCYLEVDEILRLRLVTESISDDLVQFSALVFALEDALGDITSCADKLDYVLDFFQKGE